VRSIITHAVWRSIHFTNYGLFILAIVHGSLSGTDSGTIWASAIYWVAGASTLFLTIYRIFSASHIAKL